MTKLLRLFHRESSLWYQMRHKRCASGNLPLGRRAGRQMNDKQSINEITVIGANYRQRQDRGWSSRRQKRPQSRHSLRRQLKGSPPPHLLPPPTPSSSSFSSIFFTCLFSTLIPFSSPSPLSFHFLCSSLVLICSFSMFFVSLLLFSFIFFYLSSSFFILPLSLVSFPSNLHSFFSFPQC